MRTGHPASISSPPLTPYPRHVLVMVPDPKPDVALLIFNCQSTIVITYFCSPIILNFPELNGRMASILFQQLEIFVCKFSNSEWQGIIMIPKFTGRLINQQPFQPLSLQVLLREDDQVYPLLHLLQFAHPKHPNEPLALHGDHLLEQPIVLPLW